MANLDPLSERHFIQFRHPTERSSLLARQSNAVDKIPSVEELGAIENELKRFQALGNDRTQTADKNLNLLDRLVRRMAEKKAQKVAPPKMKMSKDKDKARRGLNGACNCVQDARHDADRVVFFFVNLQLCFLLRHT